MLSVEGLVTSVNGLLEPLCFDDPDSPLASCSDPTVGIVAWDEDVLNCVCVIRFDSIELIKLGDGAPVNLLSDEGIAESG